MKRVFWLMVTLALLLTLTVAGAEDVSLDSLMEEIEEEAELDKALAVGAVTFEVSKDKQSIYLNRPEVTGSDDYTIAYNIYDSDSNPVNYFYSLEKRVAATPGYGGLFNVFVVVTDQATHEQAVTDIGWTALNWPYASKLTVGKATFTISPDNKSVFVDRPSIKCKSGSATIAYNIYDDGSQPVNYFYSSQKRVAATPGYDGKFNVFVVVTDTETGEQDVQDIGWQVLGEGPTEEEDWDGTCGEGVFWAFRDGTLTIGGQGEIPAMWEDRPWKSVQDEVQKLVIQEGVTRIGHHVFESHPNLTEVFLADSVASIGETVFYGCANLKRIEMSPDTEIGDAAFNYCWGLADSDGFVIVRGALHGHRGDAVNLVIPEGVTWICSNAIQDHLNLQTVTIPDGVTIIGHGSFLYCRNLTEVTIPITVTEIGYVAFSETGLKDIHYAGTKAQWQAIFFHELAIPRGVTIHCRNGTIYTGEPDDT